MTPFPSALFLESTDNNEVSICSPSPERWIPGQQITFRGPLGHGFRIPQLLRRMLLIGLDASPGPVDGDGPGGYRDEVGCCHCRRFHI